MKVSGSRTPPTMRKITFGNSLTTFAAALMKTSSPLTDRTFATVEMTGVISDIPKRRLVSELFVSSCRSSTPL
jgi:hypothetical protein